eukprot:gene9100-3959_t
MTGVAEGQNLEAIAQLSWLKEEVMVRWRLRGSDIPTLLPVKWRRTHLRSSSSPSAAR